MTQDRSLKNLCRDFGVTLKYKNEHSNRRMALQTYFDNPTLGLNIWHHIFPHTPVRITLPMYLAYVEAWDYDDFRGEFMISTRTYYKWVTQATVPIRHKRALEYAVTNISNPVDDEYHEEALTNDAQWKVMGKFRDYPPPKKLSAALSQDMVDNKRVVAINHVVSNKWKTLQQVRHYAETKGWREDTPDEYIRDKPFFNPKNP